MQNRPNVKGSDSIRTITDETSRLRRRSRRCLRPSYSGCEAGRRRNSNANTNAGRDISRYDSWTVERVVRWACVKRRITASPRFYSQSIPLAWPPTHSSEIYLIPHSHLHIEIIIKDYIIIINTYDNRIIFRF